MTTASNRGASDVAGLMATARKGGITHTDIDAARRAIGPRATPSMIARYLGRCVSDVQGLMAPIEGNPAPVQKSETLPARRARFRPLTERDEQFKALWGMGVSYSEIARIMGCSVAWVWQWKTKLGMPPRASQDDAA